MTSVNAVSSVSSASASSSASSTSQISEDTKKKLEALGLDPSQYTSESAAKQAIKEAQQQQMQQMQAQQGNNSGEDSITTEAKDLASRMDISVGNKDSISDILDKISDQISTSLASAATDPTKQQEVAEFQQEYTTISNEYSQQQAAKNMTGATAMADQMKYMLGLS